MMVDEQKFFAWIDGELPADEAARVEAEVAADPQLQQRAAEHRALAARLRGAFEPVAQAPVPDRLQAAIRAEHDDRVVSLAEARERREARRTLPLWQQAAALAATLAVGVFTGNMLTSGMDRAPAGPIAAEGGQLVASAELEEALYARLASAPADAGPRIRLTFRDKSGAICRTFEDHAATGFACREGGDWRIRSLFQQPQGQATDYRMASGANPQLMEVVDETISGEPFDAAQEKAAMERGWK